MNRRSFISSMLKGAIACAILPSAITYERKWIKNGSLILPKYELFQYTFLPSFKQFMDEYSEYIGTDIKREIYERTITTVPTRIYTRVEASQL